jgi:hypothetical protein
VIGSIEMTNATSRKEVGAVIVYATVAVALVTTGVMIILAKGLFRRASWVTPKASPAARLTISLLPHDAEDGGPITERAFLTIILLPDGPGEPLPGEVGEPRA